MRYDTYPQTFTANGNGPAIGQTGDVGVTVDWLTGVSAGVVKVQTASGGDNASALWVTEHTFTYASGSPTSESAALQLRGKVMRINVSSLAGGNVTVTVDRYIGAIGGSSV